MQWNLSATLNHSVWAVRPTSTSCVTLVDWVSRVEYLALETLLQARLPVIHNLPLPTGVGVHVRQASASIPLALSTGSAIATRVEFGVSLNHIVRNDGALDESEVLRKSCAIVCIIFYCNRILIIVAEISDLAIMALVFLLFESL